MKPYTEKNPRIPGLRPEKTCGDRNECNKTRPIDDPYEVWANDQGWVWHVLKKYQRPDKEAKNPHARWFVAAKSPFTDWEWEYGDTYVSDIREFGERVK